MNDSALPFQRRRVAERGARPKQQRRTTARFPQHLRDGRDRSRAALQGGSVKADLVFIGDIEGYKGLVNWPYLIFI